MSETVNFIQGSKKNYDSSTMQGGVYFSKDSKEILLNGESYGNAVPADEEDLTSVNGALQLKDREVDADNFQSKGYVILRKNIVDGKNVLTQEMINQPNTIYEIRYDFDLNGEEITIPEECTLKFEGGSLDSGTVALRASTTLISANFKQGITLSTTEYAVQYTSFRDIPTKTNLKSKDLYTENCRMFVINVANFGIIGDGVTDYSDKLIQLISQYKKNKRIFYFPSGIYKFTKTLPTPAYRSFIIGDGMDNTVLLFDTETPGMTAIENPNREYCSFRNLTLANGKFNGVTNYNPNYTISVQSSPSATGTIQYHEDSFSVDNVNGVEFCGEMDNVRIRGFSGVGIINAYANNRISNCYIQQNKIGISTFVGSTYTADLRIVGSYINAGRIGVLTKNWNMLFGTFIDEMKEYAISCVPPEYYNISYTGSFKELNLNIGACHFNHIDKSLIKAINLKNSRIDCIANRTNCNYSGMDEQDISQEDLGDACAIQATLVSNCSISLSASGAQLQDTVTVDRLTGNGILKAEQVEVSSISLRNTNPKTFLGSIDRYDNQSLVTLINSAGEFTIPDKTWTTIE